MSELPTGWRAVRLGDVVETSLGKMLDRGRTNGHRQVPYLRNVNVQWGHIDIGDLRTMEIAEADLKRFAVEDGDLLVCEGGEIGRAALWRGRTEYIAYQKALHRVRSTGEMNTGFLRYLLEWYASNGTLKRYSTGSTISHLPQQLLRALPVKLPQLEEQRRIVDILEDHLSRLDAASMLIRRSVARAERSLERTILQLLLGGPARLPAPGSSLSHAAVDRVPLPVDWAWTNLGDLADVVGGITKDSANQGDPSYVDVPYLRVANVQRGRFDLDSITTIRASQAKIVRLALQDGDVLLNEGGDRDKLARGWVWENQITPCIHQNHVFRARVDRLEVDPYFLSWVTNTVGADWAQRNATQSINLASISLTRIRQMPIPLPPLGAQQDILASIHQVVASTTRLLDTLDMSLHRAGVLRNAVLSSAFSGQLTGQEHPIQRRSAPRNSKDPTRTVEVVESPSHLATPR